MNTEMTSHEAMTQEMQQCIQNCSECHRTCLATVPHCLAMGGEHAAREHIMILLDCADICQTSADFMLRQSSMHGHICAVCAEVCEHCADECEQMAHGDFQMLACAEMCRRCAASCHHMAAQAM